MAKMPSRNHTCHFIEKSWAAVWSRSHEFWGEPLDAYKAEPLLSFYDLQTLHAILVNSEELPRKANAESFFQDTVPSIHQRIVGASLSMDLNYNPNSSTDGSRKLPTSISSY